MEPFVQPAVEVAHGFGQFSPGLEAWVNDILVWVGFGTVVGLLAKAIMPGRDPGGALVTLGMGIGGVIIGDVPSWRADNMPYGGVKQSGLGREGIRFAMEDMTEVRNLVIRTPGKV